MQKASSWRQQRNRVLYGLRIVTRLRYHVIHARHDRHLHCQYAYLFATATVLWAVGGRDFVRCVDHVAFV